MNAEITQFDINYSIEFEAITTIKKKQKNTNVNLSNNNFKYCLFNKLYYDCKHLIM